MPVTFTSASGVLTEDAEGPTQRRGRGRGRGGGGPRRGRQQPKEKPKVRKAKLGKARAALANCPEAKRRRITGKQKELQGTNTTTSCPVVGPSPAAPPPGPPVVGPFPVVGLSPVAPPPAARSASPCSSASGSSSSRKPSPSNSPSSSKTSSSSSSSSSGERKKKKKARKKKRKMVGAAKVTGQHHLEWDVPGFGKINADQRLQHLAAHCMHPKHQDCAIQRSYKESERSGFRDQGRPLGFLISWLWAGKRCKGRDGHMALSTRAKQDSPLIGFKQRVQARRWAEAQPSFQSLLRKGAFERRRRKSEGEGREPRSVVYHH